MKSVYITSSAWETKKIGQEVANKILKKRGTAKAQVLALEGDLGGGKTTFLQGFAKGLGIRQKILSPTFVILKKFKINHERFNFFYHIDCYRIKRAKEISELGFKKIADDSKNIIAVEWSRRIKRILPQHTIFINFEFINKDKRKIKIIWPKKKNV